MIFSSGLKPPTSLISSHSFCLFFLGGGWDWELLGRVFSNGSGKSLVFGIPKRQEKVSRTEKGLNLVVRMLATTQKNSQTFRLAGTKSCFFFGRFSRPFSKPACERHAQTQTCLLLKASCEQRGVTKSTEKMFVCLKKSLRV